MVNLECIIKWQLLMDLSCRPVALFLNINSKTSRTTQGIFLDLAYFTHYQNLTSALTSSPRHHCQWTVLWEILPPVWSGCCWIVDRPSLSACRNITLPAPLQTQPAFHTAQQWHTAQAPCRPWACTHHKAWTWTKAKGPETTKSHIDEGEQEGELSLDSTLLC